MDYVHCSYVNDSIIADRDLTQIKRVAVLNVSMGSIIRRFMHLLQLNIQQDKVYKLIKNAHYIDGRPGSGKTTFIKSKLQNRNDCYLALTSQTVENVRNYAYAKGFKKMFSLTIESSYYHKSNIHNLYIDEATMLRPLDIYHMVNLMSEDGQIIMTGDND